MKTRKEAWVRVYTSWKGGRKEVVNVLVTLFGEPDFITGVYRCLGYRHWGKDGMSLISYIHKDDIVKFIK